MGIKDAIKAADWVGTKRIIGMHYDTFPYIEIDRSGKKSRSRGRKRIDFA
jgi:L-ascorbate metabolism protein UlaG (beta-lactamase superfamily)